MRLPAKLSHGIGELLQGTEPAQLRRAVQLLSEQYRSSGRPPTLSTTIEQIAYLGVRMPATFGAVSAALEGAREHLAAFAPTSLLDLGAGPGTATWAAAELFPTLHRFEAVERNQAMAALGQGLMEREAEHDVEWVCADLSSWRPTRRYDLILASYSLGELASEARKQVIRRAWDVCDGALVIVEPGTRPGFSVMADVRDLLIALGAPLAAPCPHEAECPMRTAGDWCHFSTRVERTSEHRRLKQGDLGYEDEKFSYIAAARDAIRARARIIRHPLRYSGHVKLQLCTPKGLQETTIARSQKEQYRAVKRADWGSSWDFD